ncbi:MAG: lipid-A-disaccharide synthase [Opitutaceae bacterium]|nr:lipid-A-disaccharide synthase [Opitutaceae bacterium]
MPPKPVRRAELPVFLAAPRGGKVDVLLIAGEHSGDEHGARLLQDLRSRAPGLSVSALGGPEMAQAGADLLFDLTASSVVGLVEVLKNYSFFRSLFDATRAWIATYQPKAVVFIDYPGFNLRLARALRESGVSVKGGGRVKTLFYISPQIWAWKASRRFSMAEDLDALATLFPFEVACYRDTTLPVEFVGHPFLAEDHVSPVRFDPDAPILLLPGSRKQAVGRIFPVLLAGYQASGESREARVLFPSPVIESVLLAARPPPSVHLLPTGSEVTASAVLTSSGTMSLVCALAGVPGAIAYRANPLTYVMGKWLLKVPYLGIANLLLQAPMYPEYIQGAATAEALASELRSCLHDPARLARTQAQATELKACLRQPFGQGPAAWLLRQLAAAPAAS